MTPQTVADRPAQRGGPRQPEGAPPAGRPPASSTRRGLRHLGGTFASLSVRDFRNLWIGSFASQIGMWVQQVALGWLAYDLTGSATFLGVIAMARSIPSAALTLPAGVFADRFDRRRIILMSQVLTMVNAVAVTILVASGAIEPWHLALATFVSGASHSLNMPARQSLAPQLAGYQHIANAVALNSISFNTSRVLGPSIAGILVWIAGPSLCFGVQAALMVVAVVYTLMIAPTGGGHSGKAQTSIWASLVDGLNYVQRTPVVRAVFLMASVPILIGSIYNQLMPVFARDVLEVGASGMGMLMSAVGFGSTIGSFALAMLSGYAHKGRIMIACGGASGIGLIAFAMSSWFPLSIVALAFTGLTLVMTLALGQTLLNLLVPNEYRGRIMSIWSMIWSLEAIVLLPAGWLTDHAGAPITVTICGLLMVGFFIVVAMRPGLIRDYTDRLRTPDGHASPTVHA